MKNCRDLLCMDCGCFYCSRAHPFRWWWAVNTCKSFHIPSPHNDGVLFANCRQIWLKIRNDSDSDNFLYSEPKPCMAGIPFRDGGPFFLILLSIFLSIFCLRSTTWWAKSFHIPFSKLSKCSIHPFTHHSCRKSISNQTIRSSVRI